MLKSKVLVFSLALLPALMMALALSLLVMEVNLTSWPHWLQWLDLGANPIESLSHQTGDWALRFVCLTLLITPLRILLKKPIIGRFRRMIGLFTAFYMFLHVLVYWLLDREMVWQTIAEDVLKRPYITVGFLAFVLTLLLAATSTKGMMRRLGRRWQKLHRMVYLIAILGVLHYLWLVKKDITEPLIYAVMVAVLLGFRLLRWRTVKTKESV